MLKCCIFAFPSLEVYSRDTCLQDIMTLICSISWHGQMTSLDLGDFTLKAMDTGIFWASAWELLKFNLVSLVLQCTIFTEWNDLLAHYVSLFNRFCPLCFTLYDSCLSIEIFHSFVLVLKIHPSRRRLLRTPWEMTRNQTTTLNLADSSSNPQVCALTLNFTAAGRLLLKTYLFQSYFCK